MVPYSWLIILSIPEGMFRLQQDKSGEDKYSAEKSYSDYRIEFNKNFGFDILR